MKKPNPTRGKAGTRTVPNATAVKASKPRTNAASTPASSDHPQESLSMDSEARTKGVGLNLGSCEDIPEDALPPQRPDPVLHLKLSAALHLKLRNQAQDEGIPIEALAQEMLAESVVLRAWEIVERKSAMRGGHQGAGFNSPHNPTGGHRPNYGSNQNVNGNTKHPRSQYGAPGQGQGQYHNPGRNNGYQSGQGRHQNQAWMEDRAAFLEYVRNQEKRGRR